jgi:uncharacterized protein YcfL
MSSRIVVMLSLLLCACASPPANQQAASEQRVMYVAGPQIGLDEKSSPVASEDSLKLMRLYWFFGEH